LPKVPFLNPKFCGPRFETNAMPVEVLPELSAYRALVVAVAKELYRAKHNDKKRLPKGFEQRFHLEMQEVLPGSAVPVMERVLAAPLQLGLTDEFDEARDLIGLAVEEVAAGRPIPAAFPVKVLSAFKDLGRTLRPDEYVYLVPPGSATGPRFDKDVRGSLLLVESTSYTDEVDIIGELDTVGLGDGTYGIRLEDGRTLAVPDTLDRDDIMMAASALPNLVPIALRGTAVFDRHRKITKLEDVEEVSLLDSPEELSLFNASLEQLAALPADWWGAVGSIAYQEEDLRQLRWTFYRLALDYGVPLPVLFPKEPGQVRAEWRPRPRDVSMEIDLGDGRGYIHALNLQTQEEFEQDNVSLGNYEEVATVLAGWLPQEV
jgi:hypothetical protein